MPIPLYITVVLVVVRRYCPRTLHLVVTGRSSQIAPATTAAAMPSSAPSPPLITRRFAGLYSLCCCRQSSSLLPHQPPPSDSMFAACHPDGFSALMGSDDTSNPVPRRLRLPVLSFSPPVTIRHPAAVRCKQFSRGSLVRSAACGILDRGRQSQRRAADARDGGTRPRCIVVVLHAGH